jgi:hypothetical protein
VTCDRSVVFSGFLLHNITEILDEWNSFGWIKIFMLVVKQQNAFYEMKDKIK